MTRGWGGFRHTRLIEPDNLIRDRPDARWQNNHKTKWSQQSRSNFLADWPNCLGCTLLAGKTGVQWALFLKSKRKIPGKRSGNASRRTSKEMDYHRSCMPVGRSCRRVIPLDSARVPDL